VNHKFHLAALRQLNRLRSRAGQLLKLEYLWEGSPTPMAGSNSNRFRHLREIGVRDASHGYLPKMKY
jgi:hypothetical protein